MRIETRFPEPLPPGPLSRVTLLGLVLLLARPILPESAASAAPADSAGRAAGALLITSNPPGASVLVDSFHRGSTPLLLTGLPPGAHSVSVRKPGCHPFLCEVSILPGDTVSIAAKIVAMQASATMRSNRPGALFSVDGLEVGTGRVDSQALDVGSHSLSVRDPASGRTVETSVRLDQARHMDVNAEYDVVSGTRLLGGFLAPGLLQFQDRDVVEGLAFSLAGAGSAAFVVGTQLTLNDAEEAYQQALDDYDRAATEDDALRLRNIADRKYEEYSTAEDRAALAIGVLAAVWLVNAADIAIEHWTTDRITVVASVGPLGGRPDAMALQMGVKVGVSLR